MAKEHHTPESPTRPKPPKTQPTTTNLLSYLAISALIASYLYTYLNPDPTICAANPPSPSVKILSLDPFIAHISDFISASERAHLLTLGTPHLTPSTHVDSSGAQASSDYRTSSTAFLSHEDPCVARLVRRAADFQGYLSPDDINVQMTAYQPGQQYRHHYDWFSTPPGGEPPARNTISTFFAILKANCSDCGTEFPFINRTARHEYDGRWCEVIDCSKEILTTRNVEGSALFWINLDSEGKGRKDLLHAGLPAVGGEKVGLNIWTDFDVEEIWERGLFGGSLRLPVKDGQ